MTSDDEAVSGFEDHMLLTLIGGLLVGAKGVSYPVLSEEFGADLIPDSPFARDIDEIGVRTASQIQRTCAVWHAVASEQLQAVESVHRGGQWLFSTGPLLRSSLEHWARIGWVLDGGDAGQRAARAWLALLVANGEDVRTHHNAGAPTLALAGAPERLRKLCDETLPALFGVGELDCSNRNLAHWGILGNKWGTKTDAVEGLYKKWVHPVRGSGIDGRVEYRIASMFSHPSLTGSLAFMTPAEGGGGGIFKPDPGHIAKRIAVNLLAFLAVTKGLYEYLGWQDDDLDAWERHFTATLAEITRRFDGDTAPTS